MISVLGFISDETNFIKFGQMSLHCRFKSCPQHAVCACSYVVSSRYREFTTIELISHINNSYSILTLACVWYQSQSYNKMNSKDILNIVPCNQI